MFNLVKYIPNYIDTRVIPRDKRLHGASEKTAGVAQKNLSGGSRYGTDHALKNHANLLTLQENFFRLFPGKSTPQTSSPPKTSPETESSLFLGVCCVTLYIRFGVRYERVAWKITDS